MVRLFFRFLKYKIALNKSHSHFITNDLIDHCNCQPLPHLSGFNFLLFFPLHTFLGIYICQTLDEYHIDDIKPVTNWHKCIFNSKILIVDAVGRSLGRVLLQRRRRSPRPRTTAGTRPLPRPPHHQPPPAPLTETIGIGEFICTSVSCPWRTIYKYISIHIMEQ